MITQVEINEMLKPTFEKALKDLAAGQAGKALAGSARRVLRARAAEPQLTRDKEAVCRAIAEAIERGERKAA